MKTKTTRWKIVALAVGLLAFGPAAVAAGKAPDVPTRVACVGDSITYGSGIRDRARTYPAQLDRMMGQACEVRNFGVSARTLLKKGDRPYWKEKAFTQAMEFKPDAVVIKLGTNDTKPFNWKHKDELAADLAEMIGRFAELSSKPRVYVCLPVPAYADRWGIRDSVIKGELIPVLGRVAKDKGAGVIDLYAALSGKGEMFPDKIHPNADGAGLMAAEVYRALTGRQYTPPAASPEKQPKAGPIRVVILVGGHGYDQKNFEAAWGGHDDIRCEIWKPKPYTVFDDIAKFDYDVILMYNLTSGITDKQKANFLALLKRGVGLIVWHHALANCQNWPEFERIAGCKFWLGPGERSGKQVGRSGTGFGQLKMHIADPNHPITKGMKDFEIYDETYNKQTFIEGIDVLVTTDHAKSDKQIAWALKYSGARVFGCQSGHDAKAWKNPGFQRLLANGIRWVARRIGTEAGK